MAEKALYFVAVTPNQELCDIINEIKQDFVARFNSKHSLKSPPHITLQMPFQFDESKEGSIIKTLKNINEGLKTQTIQIDGFGEFHQRVIYLSILQNDGLWNLWKNVTNTLHSELGINNSYRNQGFHPHITVAFRDLKKSEFHRAWAEYKTKEFKAEFSISKLAILKHVTGRWEILAEI